MTSTKPKRKVTYEANHKLTETLWREFKTRQTWYVESFGKNRGKVSPWYSVNYATVADLRETLRLLRKYGKHGNALA